MCFFCKPVNLLETPVSCFWLTNAHKVNQSDAYHVDLMAGESLKWYLETCFYSVYMFRLLRGKRNKHILPEMTMRNHNHFKANQILCYFFCSNISKTKRWLVKYLRIKIAVKQRFWSQILWISIQKQLVAA